MGTAVAGGPWWFWYWWGLSEHTSSGSGSCPYSCSWRCALAILQQPVVKAHLDVAVSGPGRGPRPQPAAMFTGTAPGAAPFPVSWTPPAQPSQPPAQPSQPPTWPRGWDQAALAQSFSTMELTPLATTEWIADSGASYHTTPHAGILSSIRPPHSSCPSPIMVGDGSCLPVTSVGSAPGPFRLSNVLVAPQMIHNLLSIRQFTADNSCSVEFDTSGLTVKDLASRCPLLRCDSTGPLYTLRLPSSVFCVSCFGCDSVFYHLAPPTWPSWPRCFGSAQS